MDKLVWETAEEVDKELAKRVRNIRKRRSISQEKLAAMSGVSYASIKRFESTGQISLLSLNSSVLGYDKCEKIIIECTKVTRYLTKERKHLYYY